MSREQFQQAPELLIANKIMFPPTDVGNKDSILKATLLLTVMAFCLFEQVLDCHWSVFCDLRILLSQSQIQWMLFAVLAIWCGTFIVLMFSRNDLLLIVLLLISIAVYSIDYTKSLRAADAIVLLAGATLGKGVRFALEADGRWKIEDVRTDSEIGNRQSAIDNFVVGLVGLLAFASWWHLDMVGAYRGPRWMGLWDNPNIYGMLMGAGVGLAIGMLVNNSKFKIQNWDGFSA